MTEPGAIAAGLRRWTKGHDAHVRAAVELLIWHGDGYWLRRRDFGRAALGYGSHGQVTIGWSDARAFCDGRPGASTSELAILDLAVALGENRYRLSIMGSAHSRAIAEAVSRAAGIEPGSSPPALTGLQRLSIADARHSASRLDDPGAEPPSYQALATEVRDLLAIIDHLAPKEN